MRAFTIVETIVAVIIFTIIIGAVFASISALYKTHDYSWQQSMAIEETRRGIDIMTKEIREAKSGDDGSYPIEKAGDKEFIFYSDIDKDGETEKVRYFLGSVVSGSQTKECVTFASGGSCSVVFSDFLDSGASLTSAQLEVSVEGDFGWSQEYTEIYIDGISFGKVCQSGCSDCAGSWQGNNVYDITEYALDGNVEIISDSNWRVNNFCDWQEPNHSMKVKFKLSWEGETTENQHILKKGVINPTSFPVQYPPESEEFSIISYYVRNAPPIFEYFYFDETSGQLQKIEEYPAKLINTELMKILLVINVDPNRPPQNFNLESYVKLRNMKEEIINLGGA